METETSESGERLLRLPEVSRRVGLEKSAIYAGMKAGTFPPCIKLGARASAWPSSAIDSWISERIREGVRQHRGA